MKKVIKNNYKLIIGIIIGLTMSITGVYAAATAIIQSKEVSYDNSGSNGNYENVQDSIDELYERSGLLKEKWVEEDLNGADPILEVEGSTKKLIPVTIDSDGTVHYANLFTKWYNYSEKRWANAVILVDKKKDAYSTGDTINEDDIESYFVWIPRFSYKIWDMGNTYTTAPRLKDSLTDTNYETSPQNAFNRSRIIDIKFGDIKINTKMQETSAVLNNYYTHPAFTLGSKDLNGIWVGKFETGYNQDGDNGESFTIDASWTTNGANQNKNESKRVIVKPNVYSWRNNTVQNMFLSAYNYDRTLESHMMKNTEWGAVAYLSHSVYGLGGEININNNQNYVTGYGAAAGTKQDTRLGTYGAAAPKVNTDITQSYNTLAGHLASTTGNITGVYDMSGGAWEYMAAYMSGKVGSSGFELTNLTGTYKDYVDTYSAESNITSYDKRILGDATGEMGPFYQYFDGDGTNGASSSAGTLRYHSAWYTDLAHFVDSSHPWFVRGGNYADGGLGGQFNFNRNTGAVNGGNGSRLVLARLNNKRIIFFIII